MNPLETTVIILAAVAVSLLGGTLIGCWLFTMRQRTDELRERLTRLELDQRDLLKSGTAVERRVDHLENERSK